MRIQEKPKQKEYKPKDVVNPTGNIIDVSNFIALEHVKTLNGKIEDIRREKIMNSLEPSDTGLFVKGSLKSPNFVRKIKGWGVNVIKDGDAYFMDGYFAGRFAIGGVSMTVSNINELQDALNEVDVAGGGTVYLKAGTYTLTADISIPSGVTLEGVSRDDCVISCGAYKVQIVGSNAYSTGTVSVTNGSTTVTGSGTTWTSAMAGRHILLGNEYYPIVSVEAADSMTITTYAGDDLSGAAYVLATINIAASIKKVYITGGNTYGLFLQYAYEPIINDIVVANCSTAGIASQYTLYPQLVFAAYTNGIGLLMTRTYGMLINWTIVTGSTNGAGGGVYATDCSGCTFLDSAIDDNSGNGVTLIDCYNWAFISTNSNNNTKNGVELESGCYDNQFTTFAADGNDDDGIKMTTTADRNLITTCSLTNNGGYGVNIADSTCDKNIVGLNYTSVNDLGTNTIIMGNNV